ncbi:hypothetical protein VN12_25270 [Pirellula sp. SH-Sr6A]|nr:hypothetical protein VN12_25270 [Pirellula sp. SH-Sr6A]
MARHRQGDMAVISMLPKCHPSVSLFSGLISEAKPIVYESHTPDCSIICHSALMLMLMLLRVECSCVLFVCHGSEPGKYCSSESGFHLIVKVFSFDA